jgi:hypothetical protein
LENPSARHLPKINLNRVSCDRNFPQHENIFGEDEFLSPCVTDRPYCQVTGPASDLQVPRKIMKKEHKLDLRYCPLKYGDPSLKLDQEKMGKEIMEKQD